MAAIGLAAGLLWMPGGHAAESGVLHLRCTNPSGANWPLVVDLEQGRADSFPATISETSIRWRDAKGGTYELDRPTGKLDLRAASSTGGVILHYTCRAE